MMRLLLQTLLLLLLPASLAAAVTPSRAERAHTQVRPYNRPNRFTLPALGRFLTPDPARRGHNLYTYPTDPVNLWDPMGLWTEEGMYNAFFERYGEQGALLLAWAVDRGYTVKKRNYRLHRWYPEDGDIIGIAATTLLGRERSDKNAADQLMAALLDRYREDVISYQEVANLLDDEGNMGTGFTYYYIGEVLGYTDITEAFVGYNATGEDLNWGERALKATVGTLQGVLWLAPVGSLGGKLITKTLGEKAIAKISGSMIGKWLMADLTAPAGKLASAGLKKLLETKLGAGAGRAFQRFYQKRSVQFVRKVLKSDVKDLAKGRLTTPITSGTRTSFYVQPNGTIIPATGYRYISSQASYLDDLVRTGEIPANPQGIYFSFDKFNDASTTPGFLQVPHDAAIRVEFDTLQIINDIQIPYGQWNQARYLEPITKDFHQFGPGGATQAITTSGIKVTKVIDIRTGKVLYERH